MFDSWNTLCAVALADGKIYVPKNMDNPMKTGLFKISVGKIRGQIRDYRGSIDGSTLGMHIVEFLDHYEVHVDRFDPYKKPSPLPMETITFAFLMSVPAVSLLFTFIIL